MYINILTADAGAAVRELPFKRRCRAAKLEEQARASFISCHAESLTKTNTAMKSELTGAICIPVEVGGGGLVEAPSSEK